MTKLILALQRLDDLNRQTQIACKVRFPVRQIVLKNVIYKYETSSLTPFIKPCII